MHDVAVVPSHHPHFGQPEAKGNRVDVFQRGIEHFGGLEAAFRCQAGGRKGLPASEQKSHTAFQFRIAQDGIAVQEPDRMGVPDLGLGIWQRAVDFQTKRVIDRPILTGKCCVVVVDGCLGHHGTVARLYGSGKRGVDQASRVNWRVRRATRSDSMKP